MIIPVRCFTCGKVIGNKWDEYNRRVNKEGQTSGDVLDDMGILRICCRRMLKTHIDLIDKFLKYPVHPGRIHRMKLKSDIDYENSDSESE